MDDELPTIREPLKKILEKIRTDRTFMTYLIPDFYTKKFTVECLADLAGNHLSDDRFKDFGISQVEGHAIRSYFQKDSNYEFISELYREFRLI